MVFDLDNLPSIMRSGVALSLPGEQTPAALVDNSQGDFQETPLRPVALSVMHAASELLPVASVNKPQRNSHLDLAADSPPHPPTHRSMPNIRFVADHGLRRLCRLHHHCPLSGSPLAKQAQTLSVSPTTHGHNARFLRQYQQLHLQSFTTTTATKPIWLVSADGILEHSTNNTNTSVSISEPSMYRCAVSGASSSARLACSCHQLHHRFFTTQQQQWFASLASISARASYERPCAISGAS
jgi:hypothetical protein